jgi:hypothetical protein
MTDMSAWEGKDRIFAGLLSALVAPLFFAAAVGVIVLAPTGPALAVCAALYAMLVAAEARLGIYSPQNVLVAAYFAAVFVAWWMIPEQEALERYAAAGGFATLFLLALAAVVLDRPLHGLPTEAWEPRPLRRAKAGLWLAMGPSAAALALVPASATWVGAPLVLAAAAAVAAAIIDVLYCGPLYRRGKRFTLGEFTFREVERDEAAVTRFLSNYANEISAAVSRDRHTTVKYSRSEIFSQARGAESTLTARLRYFHAYHGDKIVGGVGVALDGPDRRLPVERSFGVNFDPLRRYGRIMEVRRLSVNGDYRFQPDIIRGLFKCAIEVALENDVSFMLDQAFHFVVALLAKPGFEPLHVGGRVVFEFGSPTRLIAYNFLARQFANSLDEKSRHALRFAVNQCLRSRYRHRAVIRQACAAEQRRAPLLSTADFDKLCLPGDAPHGANEAGRAREIARPS